ncbi:MAG: hypothetical protein ACK4YF_04330 [Exilispira sp.]
MKFALDNLKVPLPEYFEVLTLPLQVLKSFEVYIDIDLQYLKFLIKAQKQEYQKIEKQKMLTK